MEMSPCPHEPPGADQALKESDPDRFKDIAVSPLRRSYCGPEADRGKYTLFGGSEPDKMDFL